jgi:hypothetical protein
VLRHQDGLFHEVLDKRESPPQNLDLRLNDRVIAKLEERAEHFKTLSEYAEQAEIWVSMELFCHPQAAILTWLHILDPKFHRSARGKQQQGNLHIHNRDHHIFTALLHQQCYVDEHNRCEADATGTVAVLGSRSPVYCICAGCLPLHCAVQVQAPAPLPDYCLLAFGTLSATSRQHVPGNHNVQQRIGHCTQMRAGFVNRRDAVKECVLLHYSSPKLINCEDRQSATSIFFWFSSDLRRQRRASRE